MLGRTFLVPGHVLGRTSRFWRARNLRVVEAHAYNASAYTGWKGREMEERERTDLRTERKRGRGCSRGPGWTRLAYGKRGPNVTPMIRYRPRPPLGIVFFYPSLWRPSRWKEKGYVTRGLNTNRRVPCRMRGERSPHLDADRSDI